MIKLPFAERYQQARTYAAQVRARKAMGDLYEHARPWRGPVSLKSSAMRFKLTGSNSVPQCAETERFNDRA